jgi:hypothetical protein
MGRFRFVALAAALVLAAFIAGPAARNPHRASAASGAQLQFSPSDGSAEVLRLVSFAGFADNEVLDLTFFDPSGNQAAVGHGTVFYASTEDDGTGAFPFRPADWFSAPQNGWWTVQVVGETSGYTATAYFHIDTGF